jgi:hypothetical protein
MSSLLLSSSLLSSRLLGESSVFPFFGVAVKAFLTPYLMVLGVLIVP